MKKVRPKKTIANALALIGIATLSGSLQAASFDCAKAGTSIEKLICSNEALSKLDSELATAYKNSLENSDNKDALKQQQRTWLKEKRNICNDSGCLTKTYEDRIAELSVSQMPHSDAPLQAAGAVFKNATSAKTVSSSRPAQHKFPLKFKLVFGDSYPLCQPYVDMLNATKYMEYPACERKLLPEFKQFKAVEWVEMVNKKEIELAIEELVLQKQARFGEVGSPSHHQVLDQKKDGVASGKTRLYFFNFDFDKDGNDEVVYKENRYFAQSNESHQCNTVSEHNVLDKKIRAKDIAKYSIDKYSQLTLSTSDQLFIFNETIVNSSWIPVKNHYRIELWSAGGYQALCKILIQ